MTGMTGNVSLCYRIPEFPRIFYEFVLGAVPDTVTQRRNQQNDESKTIKLNKAMSAMFHSVAGYRYIVTLAYLTLIFKLRARANFFWDVNHLFFIFFTSFGLTRKRSLLSSFCGRRRFPLYEKRNSIVDINLILPFSMALKERFRCRHQAPVAQRPVNLIQWVCHSLQGYRRLGERSPEKGCW